ncbi:MAG: site-specific DNA-methyltransferase [Rhodopirellula sp.]|nr:site-specific DNA-methyltransferase [Rhodopirellula sp.]
MSNSIPTQLINRILWCDCARGMRVLPDGCVPMTLTSPPYDSIRQYGGHEFEFERIARELYRVTMIGGVVVWIVQEQIIDGSETGTSSYQRLYFRDLGFTLHHTMAMQPHGTLHHHAVRYGGPLQYAFVLAKGRPRSITLLKDRPNKHRRRTRTFTQRISNGQLQRQRPYTTQDVGVRGPIWFYATGRHVATERYTNIHPARMSEDIARDHIISWSRPGDLIFDPLCGVGTVPKMALLTGRHYLGMEINGPYWVTALRRLADARKVPTQ